MASEGRIGSMYQEMDKREREERKRKGEEMCRKMRKTIIFYMNSR